jgi:hypothetical protein
MVGGKMMEIVALYIGYCIIFTAIFMLIFTLLLTLIVGIIDWWENKNIPTLSSLRGIAPDITGGKLSEDFIREHRDSDW